MKLSAALLVTVAATLLAQNADAQMAPMAGTTPAGIHGFTPAPTPAKDNGPKQPLEASLAKDAKGAGTGSTFSKGDARVYLLCKNPSGAKGDQLHVVWTAVETGGVFPKNKKMSEFTQTLTGPGQGGVFYQPAPTGGFPAGKYRADLYNNGKLVKTLNFSVKK
jgi:hypothetical protein